MPPEPPRPIETAELAEEVSTLARELGGAEMKIADAHCRATALEDRLKIAIRTGPAPSPTGGAADRSLGRVAEMAIQAQARIGVEHVKITRVSKGANVSVPGHPTIRVSDAEADVLDELVKDDGPSDQGKVAWKTVDDLIRRLKKRGKGDVTPEAIRQRIYRLRQIMKAKGLNYHFVESDDEFGYRFALRSTRPGDGADVKESPKRGSHDQTRQLFLADWPE